MLGPNPSKASDKTFIFSSFFFSTLLFSTLLFSSLLYSKHHSTHQSLLSSIINSRLLFSSLPTHPTSQIRLGLSRAPVPQFIHLSIYPLSPRTALRPRLESLFDVVRYISEPASGHHKATLILCVDFGREGCKRVRRGRQKREGVKRMT